MNKKRKIIGFLSAVVFIFFVLSFFINKKQKKDTNENGGFGSMLETPSIPNIMKDNPQIDMEENIDFRIKIPSKVSLLSQTKAFALEEEYIRKTARNIGFENEPIVVKDAKLGSIYLWNSETNSLRVVQNKRTLKYSPSTQAHNTIISTPNKQLSQKDRIEIAKDFLNSNFDLNLDDKNYINTVYLTIGDNLESYGQTTEENVLIYHLNFSPIFNNLPIITINPQNYLYYVEILKDGSVLNSEVILTGNIESQKDKKDVVDEKEIANFLDKAIIVSLNEGNENIDDLSGNNLGNIQTSSIDFSYLFDDLESTNLQPIYILKGKTKLESLTNTQEDLVPVTLYLPAIK